MGLEQNKVQPPREDRLSSCIVYGGKLGDLTSKTFVCPHLNDGERSFEQGSICLLLPAISILNTIPDNVNLVHGAVGCGACSHSQNANARSGSTQRTGDTTDAIWLSTALTEIDVINGAENKLYEAIVSADRLYNPKTITVIVSCVPAIIGDDIDSVIAKAQPEVSATIVPIHCEGFKTRIWATAYDAVYHGIAKTLFDEPKIETPLAVDETAKAKFEYERAHTVNLFSVSSMGLVDENELVRYLKALDLSVNTFPNFASTDNVYKLKYARLSISTCPTHDDYLLSHLKEVYDVDYIIRHMPIGIENTNEWILDVAKEVGESKLAERFIERETQKLDIALKPYREFFKGKRVFVAAGEFRALATANLLYDLGFDIVGIRSFHHDEFANVEYEKLLERLGPDLDISIANVQPFEEANILKRVKPDLFLGHWNGNSTASKLGIPSHVIYNTGLAFIGYKGAFELARRLMRQLRNPILNQNLSKYLKLPYREDWYDKDPFTYIKKELETTEVENYE